MHPCDDMRNTRHQPPASIRAITRSPLPLQQRFLHANVKNQILTTGQILFLNCYYRGYQQL